MVVLSVVLLGAASAPAAAEPAAIQSIPIDSAAKITIDVPGGLVYWPNHTYQVAGIGDANGDGEPDLAVGVPETWNGALAGRAFVVFGQSTPTTIDLSALGTNGYEIKGAKPIDQTGWAVSAIGDVNKDGLADLALGARRQLLPAGGEFAARCTWSMASQALLASQALRPFRSTISPARAS